MPFPSPTFTNFIRSAGGYLADEFESLYAQLEGYLRTEHQADGSHGDVTADSVEIRPHGWVTGESPLNGTNLSTRSGIMFPSGDFITNLPNLYSPGEVWSVKNILIIGPGPVTFLGDINTGSISVATGETISIGGVEQGAWTSYTPTWAVTSGAAPAVGDGTLVGSYARIGNTIHWRLSLTAGSTTSFGSGGAWTFTLPVTSATYNALTPMAQVTAFDSSGGTAFSLGQALYSTTTTVLPRTGAALAVITDTAPWTWASGDVLVFMGTYEAA